MPDYLSWLISFCIFGQIFRDKVISLELIGGILQRKFKQFQKKSHPGKVGILEKEIINRRIKYNEFC